MRDSVLRFATLAAILAPFLSGCDERPERVPVSGQVLIDGQPLTHGYVRIVPADGRPAIGQLDAEGRFHLTTFDDNDGCIVGTHPLTVVAKEQITPTRMKWLTPKKYQDVATTDQQVTIDAPTDNLLVELSWEGSRPFVEDSEAGAASPPPSTKATSALQD